jgi:hypothetical protein
VHLSISFTCTWKLTILKTWSHCGDMNRN